MRHIKIIILGFLILALAELNLWGRAAFVEALETRAHPIYDLIEGDKRTPPEEENPIEKRPATPSYPLPSTLDFAHATAIETFPEEEPLKRDASAMGDEWEEWSSWEDWSDLEDWDHWEDAGTEKADSVSPETQANREERTEEDSEGNQEAHSGEEADTGSEKTEEWEWEDWTGETEGAEPASPEETLPIISNSDLR